MYGNTHLNIYKNFFFIDPKNFILKSWLFFFIKFCEFNRISLLFIFDYTHYINFYKNISDSDLSVSAIIPYFYTNDYIDYPLYSYSTTNLIKVVYSSYIFQIHSLAFNNLSLVRQYLFFRNTINFFKKINII